MPNPDLGNVPSQPVYGEVKQIEEQQAGAPLPQAEEAPVEAPLPAQTAPTQPMPPGPSNRNIVDVLPPLSFAPSNTWMRPLRSEQELAYLILGTPGMGQLTRDLAAQVVGRYSADTYTSQEQLDQRFQIETAAGGRSQSEGG